MTDVCINRSLLVLTKAFEWTKIVDIPKKELMFVFRNPKGVQMSELLGQVRSYLAHAEVAATPTV